LGLGVSGWGVVVRTGGDGGSVKALLSPQPDKSNVDANANAKRLDGNIWSFMRKSLSHEPQSAIILYFGVSGFVKNSTSPSKPASVNGFAGVVEFATDLKSGVDSGQKRVI
jgi:hypothetical protein